MSAGWRLLLVIVTLESCGNGPPSAPPPPPPVLRVAIASEPLSWNRLLANDWVTHMITDQIHAPLIRLNPETQKLEPVLAKSWEFVGDRLVFHLREGLRFSDGEPFKAGDVHFTFRVLHDEDVGSQLADTARIDGEPIECEVLDDLTVAFRLPRRTASVERIFDSIRILPAHRLEASLERKTIAADTGRGAAPGDIVGLGPFRLRTAAAGQRIVLERNPYYFRNPEGLPKLEALVFEIIPDANARVLRLEGGDVDVVELDPQSFATLVARPRDGIEASDAGPSMMIEKLWFNLNPKSPIPGHKKAWFQDVRFRRAVSLAIDREALARVVFRGLASPAIGPVSPANTHWVNEAIPAFEHDREKARALLAEAGFRRDGDGPLRDLDGHDVAFTIITRSDDVHEKIGAFLQQQLAPLGIDARAVPTESASLGMRLMGSYDYDAAVLAISSTDPDPSAEMAMWMSSAPLHFWHPKQERPGTDWEKRIDELMESQLGALDPAGRRAAFDEVQLIAREQLPMIELVVPHSLLAFKSGVRQLRPTAFTHALWNSEEIAVSLHEGKSTHRQRRDIHH